MARILIVEDERVVAWNIRDILRLFHHDVVANVATGLDAIRIATETRPDLVLMDIRLKGQMDGIEAAQHILNQLNIPVIYLTAHADEQTLQQAIATAPFGYVIKPFNRIELHAAIETALSRHERQQQVEAAQRWLKITLNSLGDAMIATDKEGRVTFVNPAAEEITGWTQTEAVGQPAEQLLQLIQGDTGDVIENPILVAIRNGGRTTVPDNCLLLTRMGLCRSVGDSAAPIRNEKGDIIGGVLIFQDITERKQAEAAYNEVVQQRTQRLEGEVRDRTRELELAYTSEALLRRIITNVRQSLDSSQILRVALDELLTHLNVQYCNAVAYIPTDNNQYRYSITHECSRYPELSGLILSDDDYPTLTPQLLSGQVVQLCIPLAAYPNGWGCGLLCPMIDDQGTILGDLLLVRDREESFTELEVRLVQLVADQCAIAIRQARLYEMARAQVEQLEALNRLKDEFLNNVSHELRTPMSNINLAIHMLEVVLKPMGLLTGASDAVGRYFSILQEESQKEIKLINDLLDLSRLEAGAEIVIPSRLELQNWLPHQIEPFIARVSQHHQTIDIEIPASLPLISTDASCLARIMAELLNNACKFTPNGDRILVSAHLEQSDAPQGVPQIVQDGDRPPATPTPRLVLRVCNTGGKIPAEALPHLFDKFYRVPELDTKRYGGTGLGLALVKRLVEHLQGTIQVTSDSQQTCFAVSLPIELPQFPVT